MRTEAEIQADIDGVMASMNEIRSGKMVKSTTSHDGSGAVFVVPSLDDLRKELLSLQAELEMSKSGGSAHAPVRMCIKYD